MGVILCTSPNTSGRSVSALVPVPPTFTSVIGVFSFSSKLRIDIFIIYLSLKAISDTTPE